VSHPGRPGLKAAFDRLSDRRRWVRRAGVGAVCAGLGLSLAVPVASADVNVSAGATAQYGLNAVTTANRYVAWRVTIPTSGFVSVNDLGVTDGTATAFAVSPVGSGYGCCGGGSAFGFQAAPLGRPVQENGYVTGIGGGVSVNPGDYYLVQLIGGGTASIGAVTVQVQAPSGTTIDGFTTGPAKEFTDIDFAQNSGSLTGPQPGDPIVGSVPFSAASTMWGMFYTVNQTATISYTDPSGQTSQSYPWGWTIDFAGAPPGTYSLHLDEGSFSPGPNSQGTTVALMADIQLP
jgi:hypothetical protein